MKPWALLLAVAFTVLACVVLLAISLLQREHNVVEVDFAPDRQRAAAVKVAEVYAWWEANTTTTTTSSTTSTTVAPRARTAPKRPTVRVQAVGDRVDLLAACESNMNQRAYNPAGPYFSFYQWSLSTWRQAGGTGHPYDAPYAVQKRLAIAWAAKTSWASQWPVCSRRVGLAS